MLKLISHSIRETLKIGKKIGLSCQSGDIFALSGDLGAGKTVLTQGIADGLGIQGFIHSPTFTLINEYSGRFPLFHLDFYRLQNPHEIEELGLEEYAQRKGIMVIEWADKFNQLIPEPRWDISIHVLSENEREFQLNSVGDYNTPLENNLKEFVSQNSKH